MPFDIRFARLPQGIAIKPARDGEVVEVLATEYVSTEDGQALIQRLEGFANDVLALLPRGQCPIPSQIDHMLVVVRTDHSATVYLNELSIVGHVRASRAIKKGEAVTCDDISDIIALDLGVDIPADAGFMVLLSHGWRRGLFYDWRPLIQGCGSPRAEDLRVVFAQIHSHLLFQEFHSLTEADWRGFFAEQWFPFKSLKRDTLLKMRGHVQSGWSIDEVLPEIVEHVRASAALWVETWRKDVVLSPHIEVLERGVQRFLDGDYMSTTHLIYPRIEGIIRNDMRSTGERATQSSMAERAGQSLVHMPKSLLLPKHFVRYLKEVYFANFDPKATGVSVSRNSVGHGVASTKECNEKAAVIGLLIARHLSLCLSK